MKKPSQPSLAYKLGQCLGWPMAWVLKKQLPIINWLVARGFSKKFARLALTAANLTILVAVLLAITPNWLLAIVVILAAIMFVASSGVDIELSPPQKEEWRMGPSGWGLYRGDECIIWPDDPNDPNE